MNDKKELALTKARDIATYTVTYKMEVLKSKCMTLISNLRSIVHNIETRGNSAVINSLGEVQGCGAAIDCLCAEVGMAKEASINLNALYDALHEDVITTPIAMNINKVVRAFRFEDDEKIAAIKALRSHCVDLNLKLMGLADAKWAIENFRKFIRFVEKHERLPKPEFINGLK